MPDKKDAPPPAGWNVTYQGPEDRRDRTTTYEVQHAVNSEVFPLGQKVTGVSKRTADRLANQAGHKFKIEPAEPEGDK